MIVFPEKYRALNQNVFKSGNYRIVPVRYEDRLMIMKWRNEQIYHLRQSRPLTEEDQNNYFNNVVAKLFEQEKPNQILFSYLQNDDCTGYGGLVHINWIDKNAEISFIINTALEKEEFHKHWGIYLDLIERVAFQNLNLHKLYTYAFDIRPHLYEAIESKGYEKEAVLKEHCFFDGKYKNVIIHSKINSRISLRKVNVADKELVFHWANDELTRSNSFNSQAIDFEAHSAWFDEKLKDENAVYFIGEINRNPIGLVRFDKKDNEVVVGILLDNQYRGQGLASELLKLCCTEYQKEKNTDIYALIKNNNIASYKSFTNAGFILEKTLKINELNEIPPPTIY
jgi:RimJ/RimL family protein N-acetyltransferase